MSYFSMVTIVIWSIFIIFLLKFIYTGKKNEKELVKNRMELYRERLK